MRLRINAVSHRGHARAHNEDALGWGGWSLQGDTPVSVTTDVEVTGPTTIVVCDGLGGHAGGATASRVACESLTAPDAIADITDGDHLRVVIGKLLQQISDGLNDLGEQRPELHAMGCTVVGVTVLPDASVLVFNVGDSRAYRLEGNYLAQLSLDHRALGSNLLQQALGAGRRVLLEPAFFDCRMPSGPGILLCTDGLDDYADPEAIERLIRAAPAELPVLLRDLALAGGGGDNVTVVQVRRCPDNEGIEHG
ncbi:PP2C family protein-serine/threonine phosphatase [Nocardia sp. NPDC059240]|uniref:PP2C family protein-serine/threonine phosphatase n=1 Tax=Nocardia sp. NPDC059240 TaxID=3346786 RepID=UPI0036B734E6